MLMAGRHPDIWAGVSAWVPISDLKAWYHECEKSGRKYFRDVASAVLCVDTCGMSHQMSPCFTV